MKMYRFTPTQLVFKQATDNFDFLMSSKVEIPEEQSKVKSIKLD